MRAGVLAAALTVALALAVPATAGAFTPTAMTAAPANAQATANSDFTIDFGIDDPAADLRSFSVHLPPGEWAALAATPKCTTAQFSAKACPAGTQAGTATATLDDPGLDPIAGTIYRLAPPGSAPGRLGLRLRLPTGDETLLQSAINVRTGDHGLDFTFTGMPRLPGTHITELSLTLAGTAGAPATGYMSNPSTCAPAATAVDATAYDGSSGSATAMFTPTGCATVPFAPTLTAIAAGTAVGARAQLMAIVQWGPHQAAPATIALTLPAGISPVQATQRACAATRVAAQSCPLSAQVGSVQAHTPVVAAALQGPIVLATSPIGALPAIVLDFRGPFDMQVRAPVSFGPFGRLLTIASPFPDLPLSQLTLTLNAGDNGMLINRRDLCDAPAPTIDAGFTARTGASAAGSAIVATPGCATVVPRISAQLKGIRRHKPSLSLRVRATTGPRLTSVAVSLPRTVRVLRKRARRALAVVSGGLRVVRPSLRARTRSLTVRALPNGGSRAIRMNIHRGAMLAKRSVRQGARVRIVVTTVDATGRARKRALRVRAGR
jgi:hypothetical protein